MQVATTDTADTKAADRSYDLFVSYATDPDYALARELESFLETFHTLPTPEDLSITELRVCVDSSDFHASGGSGEVGPTIDEYLGKSKKLLVLCSRNARQSKWVGQEVAWFLENRDH